MAMVAAGARGGCGLYERRDLLRRRRQQPTSALLLYVAAARENRGGGQTSGRDREDRKSISGARTFRHSTGISLKHDGKMRQWGDLSLRLFLVFPVEVRNAN